MKPVVPSLQCQGIIIKMKEAQLFKNDSVIIPIIYVNVPTTDVRTLKLIHLCTYSWLKMKGQSELFSVWYSLFSYTVLYIIFH
jgi:hypothetical protein